MLSIYRRHRKNCTHRLEGRGYRRCLCTIWVDGTIGQREVRKSLKIRDWQKAQDTVREWESQGRQTDEVLSERMTVAGAAREFIADAEARKLKERTIYKFRLLFRQLETFAKTSGIQFLEQLDISALRRFRASWKDGDLSALKKLERMRSFFRFAHESGWLDRNPVVAIKNPKVTMRPTLPYSREEMLRLVRVATTYIHEIQPQGQENAIRLRALMLLLRYSGLRIGDAVGCRVDRLVDGKLRLYTQKTGTHVFCPLPEFVVQTLGAIPRLSANYWFWNGTSKLKTAVTSWQERIVKLAKKAKIPNGHAHRFRDTFATQLLLEGVPLERVSILLGHQSIKVTERHYSPWIRERQQQAEADVRRTWTRDPLLLIGTKGTRRVHGEARFVN